MSILISQKVKYKKGTTGNTEWWTDEDWKRHQRHVEALKNSGEYMMEEECTITIVYNELFDGPLSNYENNKNYTITKT